MTMSLEMQREELKAELRNACDAGERRQIAAVDDGWTQFTEQRKEFWK